jgi:tetratricopeptide (TPR) repeat protein
MIQTFDAHAPHVASPSARWGSCYQKCQNARAGLALTLWELGRYSEAIDHAQALIRLNPRDHQGFHDLLANWLLVVDDEAVERLLAQFPDEWNAQRAYTRALLAYRAYGWEPEASDALAAALAVNPYVLRYLLHVSRMASAPLGAYAVGTESERSPTLSARRTHGCRRTTPWYGWRSYGAAQCSQVRRGQRDPERGRAPATSCRRRARK